MKYNDQKMQKFIERTTKSLYEAAKQEAANKITHLMKQWNFTVPGWDTLPEPCSIPHMHTTKEDQEMMEEFHKKAAKILETYNPNPPTKIISKQHDTTQMSKNSAEMLMKNVNWNKEDIAEIKEIFRREDYALISELALRQDLRTRMTQKQTKQEETQIERKRALEEIEQPKDGNLFMPPMWVDALKKIAEEDTVLVFPNDTLKLDSNIEGKPCSCASCDNKKKLQEVLTQIIESPSDIDETTRKEIDEAFVKD